MTHSQTLRPETPLPVRGRSFIKAVCVRKDPLSDAQLLITTALERTMVHWPVETLDPMHS